MDRKSFTRSISSDFSIMSIYCLCILGPLVISRLWWPIATFEWAVLRPLTATGSWLPVTTPPPTWKTTPSMPAAALQDPHAPLAKIPNIPICALPRKYMTSTHGNRRWRLILLFYFIFIVIQIYFVLLYIYTS